MCRQEATAGSIVSARAITTDAFVAGVWALSMVACAKSTIVCAVLWYFFVETQAAPKAIKKQMIYFMIVV
jgi:hypothetical protein